jgi:hypothetical protein
MGRRPCSSTAAGRPVRGFAPERARFGAGACRSAAPVRPRARDRRRSASRAGAPLLLLLEDPATAAIPSRLSASASSPTRPPAPPSPTPLPRSRGWRGTPRRRRRAALRLRYAGRGGSALPEGGLEEQAPPGPLVPHLGPTVAGGEVAPPLLGSRPRLRRGGRPAPPRAATAQCRSICPSGEAEEVVGGAGERESGGMGWRGAVGTGENDEWASRVSSWDRGEI